MKSCWVFILITLVAFMIGDTCGGAHLKKVKKIFGFGGMLIFKPRPPTTITEKCRYGIHFLDGCGIKYTCDPSTGLTRARDQIPCQLEKAPRKCSMGYYEKVYDPANFLCYCNREIEDGDTYECFAFYPSQENLEAFKENNVVNPFVDINDMKGTERYLPQ